MKRWRMELVCVAAIAATWLGYLTLAPTLAKTFAARLGPKLLQATQGNVADASVFISLCFREVACLLSAVLVAVLIYRFLTRLVLKWYTGVTAAWACRAVAIFVLVNVWLAVAMQTTVFWCLFWQGKRTDNLVRFRLKAELLRAHPSVRKAVILGNSQARAQLDEELLNELLDPPLHTAELHFPGARAYDFLLVNREIEFARPQVLICYVSELSFYAGSDSVVAPVFFGVGDVGEDLELRVTSHLRLRQLAYGLLGEALPIFKLRDVLGQRLLGWGLTHVKEREHVEKVHADVATTTREVAKQYRRDVESEFQQRAFAAFVDSCEKRKQTLVILAGQLNPTLSRQFAPEMRADFLSNLRRLRDQHANIVLFDDLPPQDNADYDDLTHVNKTKQQEFTRYLAGQLQAKILAPPAN